MLYNVSIKTIARREVRNKMDIKELNYIVAVAEEGSISKASERLFMAQSSLSQFIMNLEHEINTKLFVRTSKGV